jgi:hypothetical protein
LSASVSAWVCALIGVEIRRLVVVADEHERRLHHGGQVDALVERALRGRAVAEEHHRHGLLALQLLAPRDAGRLRDVRRGRDADRGEVPVGRVPPAGRMAAPPLEHDLRRQPAHEADRRLAVAREDPVLVAERVGGARLDRLVVPGDRVGADPALTVVHHGALVEGAKQHHPAVQLEQVLFAEPVGDGVPVEHPPQRRQHLGHLRRM